ncbi:MAG: hypothetical protein ACXWZT_11655 [Gaiellaceae bacterium]
MEEQRPAVAFYTIADERYFVGAVALINSLRLVGHDEPVVVLDCGLSPEQRDLLAGEVRVLEAPERRPAVLLKPAAPLDQPADVMVLVDADAVVVRHLGSLVARAAEGKVVAFEAPGFGPRTSLAPQWGEALGVPIAGSRGYVNAGFLIIAGDEGRSLLEDLDTFQRRIDPSCTWLGGVAESEPFFYADQDVLNAILAMDPRRDTLEIVDHRLAQYAPLRGVRVVDAKRLICSYADGVEPYCLHHILAKPWLARVAPNAYSLLLPRLLFWDDVAIKLRPEMLPRRFRTGVEGAAARQLNALRWAVHNRVRGKLGIRRRLDARRASRARTSAG